MCGGGHCLHPASGIKVLPFFYHFNSDTLIRDWARNRPSRTEASSEHFPIKEGESRRFARMLEFTPKTEKSGEPIKTIRQEILRFMKKQPGFLDLLPFENGHHLDVDRKECGGEVCG
jgi:hypothetical protein